MAIFLPLMYFSTHSCMACCLPTPLKQLSLKSPLSLSHLCPEPMATFPAPTVLPQCLNSMEQCWPLLPSWNSSFSLQKDAQKRSRCGARDSSYLSFFGLLELGFQPSWLWVLWPCHESLLWMSLWGTLKDQRHYTDGQDHHLVNLKFFSSIACIVSPPTPWFLKLWQQTST